MCRPTTLTCGWPTTPLGDVEDRVDVEAELDALDAGVGLGVRLGRQVGVDAQGDLGGLPIDLATSAEGVQLRLALDVEQQDAVLQA